MCLSSVWTKKKVYIDKTMKELVDTLTAAGLL